MTRKEIEEKLKSSRTKLSQYEQELIVQLMHEMTSEGLVDYLRTAFIVLAEYYVTEEKRNIEPDDYNAWNEAMLKIIDWFKDGVTLSMIEAQAELASLLN